MEYIKWMEKSEVIKKGYSENIVQLLTYVEVDMECY